MFKIIVLFGCWYNAHISWTTYAGTAKKGEENNTTNKKKKRFFVFPILRVVISRLRFASLFFPAKLRCNNNICCWLYIHFSESLNIQFIIFDGTLFSVYPHFFSLLSPFLSFCVCYDSRFSMRANMCAMCYMLYAMWMMLRIMCIWCIWFVVQLILTQVYQRTRDETLRWHSHSHIIHEWIANVTEIFSVQLCFTFISPSFFHSLSLPPPRTPSLSLSTDLHINKIKTQDAHVLFYHDVFLLHKSDSIRVLFIDKSYYRGRP